MTEENAKNEKKPTTNDVEDAAEARGGERWKHDRKQYRDFVAFDEPLERKLLRQIEFYFSDSNLPRDKFLRETVEADPERYVDIALLLTFSRLRTLLSPFGSCEDGVSVACVAA